MHHLVDVAGLFAGVYAFTYGRWLQKSANPAGALLAYVLAGLCLGLPALRLALVP